LGATIDVLAGFIYNAELDVVELPAPINAPTPYWFIGPNTFNTELNPLVPMFTVPPFTELIPIAVIRPYILRYELDPLVPMFTVFPFADVNPAFAVIRPYTFKEELVPLVPMLTVWPFSDVIPAEALNKPFVVSVCNLVKPDATYNEYESITLLGLSAIYKV
jgi:hypothetical protein